MSENEISAIVVDTALSIHVKLGPGLLETVYCVILAHELRKHGLTVDREVPIPLRYENLVFEESFRADLIIDSKVIIEVKSLDKLAPIHKKQLLTYLRLTDIKLGLVINFGDYYLKDGIARVINGLDE